MLSLWLRRGHRRGSIIVVCFRLRLLTSTRIGGWKDDGKQPRIEFFVWFEWYGVMSYRDGYRRRGHEGGVVEPVEKDRGDIGGENMYMFLVSEICPDNVGLDDIKPQTRANQGTKSLCKTYPICRPVCFSFVLRRVEVLPLRHSD